MFAKNFACACVRSAVVYIERPRNAGGLVGALSERCTSAADRPLIRVRQRSTGRPRSASTSPRAQRFWPQCLSHIPDVAYYLVSCTVVVRAVQSASAVVNNLCRHTGRLRASIKSIACAQSPLLCGSLQVRRASCRQQQRSRDALRGCESRGIFVRVFAAVELLTPAACSSLSGAPTKPTHFILSVHHVRCIVSVVNCGRVKLTWHAQHT